MSQSISFDIATFSNYLHKPIQKFILDLSGYSVSQILEEYQKFKRKTSPKYSLTSLLYNITLLEKQFSITLEPLQVTDDFYTYFYVFLLQQGCRPSTISTYFSQLRASLAWGIRHNLTVSPTYDQFKIGEYERQKVALTADEVSLIYHYDIRKNFAKTEKGRKRKESFFDTMDRVRCQFVLACSLGQRYSDIKRINPSCFSDDKQTFTIIQQKTGNKAVVHIPTFAYDKRVVAEILEKYNYYAPYPHALNDFNDHLHLLLKTIGENFNDVVKSTNKIRGEIVEEESPKWKVISSHTARRSFATLNVARGITEPKIRRATGHKDSRSFCQYIIWGENE